MAWKTSNGFRCDIPQPYQLVHRKELAGDKNDLTSPKASSTPALASWLVESDGASLGKGLRLAAVSISGEVTGELFESQVPEGHKVKTNI